VGWGVTEKKGPEGKEGKIRGLKLHFWTFSLVRAETAIQR